MDNFQLYRTNLYLGGQMKWDLVVNSNNNELYVDNFHLSPISANIPYNYKSEELLLNNKHQDNVKSYYKKTKGYFYSEGLDSEFSHNYPLIGKPNEILNVYSNTYDMGCKRMKHYNLYKKQFEFFCPIWIEHLTDDLKFKFTVRPINSTYTIATNVLKISKNNIFAHNKFVDYFNNYVADCGLFDGTDSLLNVSFSDYTAQVTGLNVSNGLFVTKNQSNLINNITLCERPVMEVDNMLMDCFKTNNIICKQLFNFNLCFNVEDILSGSITNMLIGQELIVSVDVYIGDTQLNKMDFYTNYEHLERQLCLNNVNNSKYTANILSILAKNDCSANVFDYLKDNECLEIINKNKFCQNICHWSLCNNSDYIFNVYNGFSGISYNDSPDTNNILYENNHQYGNTPNTIVKKNDKSQNSTGWINAKVINKWNDFYKYIKNTNKHKSEGIHLNGSQYISGVKYKYHPNAELYIIGLKTTNSMLATIVDAFNDCVNLWNRKLYALLKDDLLILLTSDENYLTFSVMYDNIRRLHECNYKYVITNANNEEEVIIEIINEDLINKLSTLYNVMKSKEDPKLIVFGAGLIWNTADGPTTSVSEKAYYKDINTREYILRYDGKIKPSFVTNKNILYYKDYLSDDRTNGLSVLQQSNYIKYINSGYEPLYPSIDYYATKKIIDWTYETPPKVNVTEHINAVNIYNTPEYSWFNNSIIIITNPEIHFKHVCRKNEDGKYDTINDIVYQYLCNKYNIDNDDIIRYIMTKYEIQNNWEYYSDTNITDYIYNITLKLK